MAKDDKKIKALLEQAEQGIKDVFESDNYRNYLATMAKFHSYSFRNCLLILMQNPDASRVAGYNTWQTKFHRHVLRGEKGIQIIGYISKKINVEQERKDSNENILIDTEGKPIKDTVTKQIPSFTPVYVYDVSQTEGEPLPQLINELKGDVDIYNDLMTAIKEVSPFPIVFEVIQDGAKGYCNPAAQKIAINIGMSEMQNIKTAIHEVTHADLHTPTLNIALNKKTTMDVREIEAESTAFVVCSHYGINTSNYTFPYLASWSSSKEVKELQSSLETIQKQAGELIEKIDTRLEQLQKDNEKMMFAEITKVQINEVIVAYQEGPARTFEIYQFKQIDATQNFRFESLNFIKKNNNGLAPTLDMYNKVYSGSLPNGKDLDDIYTEFNINRPEDFTGHSLSVSDLIVVECQGIVTANFVDGLGFENIPALSAQIEASRAEQTAAEETRRADEMLDSIKFDGDIDLDREKTREQLGFHNQDKPQPQKPIRMKERFTTAQIESDRRADKHNKSASNKDISNERGGI